VGPPHAGDEVVDADSLAASLDVSAATVRSWLYRRELDADTRRVGSALLWWRGDDCQRVPSEPTAPVQQWWADRTVIKGGRQL
jgi:hypothetical protein